MRTAIALAFALLLASPAVQAAEADSLEGRKAAALARALAFLQANAEHEEMSSAYLVEAIVGVGLDPGLWPSPAANILDRVDVPVAKELDDNGDREIHAIAQSGYDPRDFHGRDLIAELPEAWAVDHQGVGQASFTLLALHAGGVPRGDAFLEQMVSFLQQGQSPDGGWGCQSLPSADCTGFALTALRSVDAFLPTMPERARIFLDSQRHADGGYGYSGHILADVSNTDSTIWALHGYRAIGAAEPAESWEFLLDQQRQDGGFPFLAGSRRADLFATVEVVAGWTRSFHELPVYAPALVQVPEVHVGAPLTFRLDGEGFADATWQAGGATMSGNPATFTFTAPGPVALHVEAHGKGTHHRERIALEVLEAPDLIQHPSPGPTFAAPAAGPALTDTASAPGPMVDAMPPLQSPEAPPRQAETPPTASTPDDEANAMGFPADEGPSIGPASTMVEAKPGQERESPAPAMGLLAGLLCALAGRRARR